MRNRSFLIIFGSLVLWGIITYFLFLDQPVGKGQEQNELSNQIDKLEKRVKQQIAANLEYLRKHEEEERNKKILLDKLEKINIDKLSETKDKEVPHEIKIETGIGNKEAIAVPEPNIQPTTVKSIPPAVKKILPNGDPIIAVLVFSCNRVTVRRCLDQLIKLRPSPEQFPIVVSQDCEHKATADVIANYGSQVLHIKQPDQSDIEIPPKEKKFKGYFKIARHYGWALNQIFVELGYETAIVVEDDLDIAPDFFEYFLGTYPLLVADQSLWCVSAWNDNGKAGLVDEQSAHLLYRTDFFPGLGWMLTRDLWLELAPKWPKSYWDDWIRQPEQRKNRACIRPEMSRTRTFGKIGVSNGLFFDKHLKYIKLNDQYVPFRKLNLTYLLKDNYDINFVNEVYNAAVVTQADLKSGKIAAAGPVRIPYNNRQAYKYTARLLGLMDDFKSGVPRTGYRGVVTFFYNGRRVHLAPNANWSGYDITWS